MKKCQEAIDAILLAEEGLDRETLEHCRNCPSCRKLLRKRIAFMSSPAREPSATLDSMVLAACLKRRQRTMMFRRIPVYACSFLFCVLCFAGTTYWFGSGSVKPEMPERNELAEELADVRFSLTRISREISKNQMGELQ